MQRTMADRRRDHLFFSGLALLLIGYASLGFWKSYLGAGLILAPLPSLLVHFHGILFVGWLVLFATQIGLVWQRRFWLHRQLGIVMAFWAAAMIIIGPLTTIMALRRPHSGVDAGVLAGDLSLTIVFAILLGLGFLRRGHAFEHKRLMMLATSAVIAPAIVRWPFDFIQKGPPYWALLFYLVPPLLLAVYDLATRRRVYGGIWFGLGLMAAVFVSFVALPAIPAWIALSNWIRQA